MTDANAGLGDCDASDIEERNSMAIPGVETAIILLNYCGWTDTIACVESLLRMDRPFGQVIVCDNASPDDSLKHLRREFEVRSSVYEDLWKRLGGARKWEVQEVNGANILRGSTATAPLVLVETGGNLGFAAGNNVGLRLALRRPDNGYFWLLNNDTEVAPTALSALLCRAQERPSVGLWGATVVYHADPQRLQATGGGGVNWWTAATHHLNAFRPASTVRTDAVYVDRVESQMAYVLGASMMATRDWVETIGLLDERYFLYYEELDWATRAHGRARIGYAPDCVVAHKEGASIGTAPKGGSSLSLHHLSRSRVLFARRFMTTPRIGATLVSCMIQQGKLLARGRWSGALAAFQGMLSGLTCKERSG